MDVGADKAGNSHSDKKINNMGYIHDLIMEKLNQSISDDMEKYTQMSIGSNDLKWLHMFYIPEEYRMPVDATKGMSIEELHSICELCLNKYFGAVQNGIENPPTLNAIVGYPMGENLLFYFAMEFLNKENKFIRASEIKCSCTHADNHKIEYEVMWPDGGISLLNSEFQFVLQQGQSKPYKCSQCIHVYDYHDTKTKKGIALYGIKEDKYYFNNYLSIIKTNGEFLQIPMDDVYMKGRIMSLPIPFGILHEERTLLIENLSGVYAFDIYRGYICHIESKKLSELNQDDMARIWFEGHPMNY